MLVITLLLIFTTALLLRVVPLFNAQPIVRAFDPWFQLKVTDYVAENGFGAFFTWYDETTWVPFGRDMARTSYVGVPFTSAFFYFLLNGIGIHVDVLTVSLFLPAFMGALTAVVAFSLGESSQTIQWAFLQDYLLHSSLLSLQEQLQAFMIMSALEFSQLYSLHSYSYVH
jgi:asparagine N-glycosylation enzyme membrane subunit Stt3